MADIENFPPRRSARLRSGTTAEQRAPMSSSLPSYESPTKAASTAPLRIAKTPSRTKAPALTTGPALEDTTLRDLSPGSSRRNSPSAFHIRDKIATFQGSPNKTPPASPQLGMPKSDSASTVRSFWQNAASGGTPEDSKHERTAIKNEVDDLKNRRSLVKNNIFLANDMKDRESSPKLTMSPSQHRLSSQMGEVATSTPQITSSPTRIPVPVEVSQSPRKDARPTSVATNESGPKSSCLHSVRIKGPRQNPPDETHDQAELTRRERRKTVTFDQAPQVHEFDRRSSHGTTTSDRSCDDKREDDSGENSDLDLKGSRPLPSIPASRPLPQVPQGSSDTDRPSSKDSNDSYSEMEERIRSMLERVVLREEQNRFVDNSEQEDIFSLYTTTNEMDDEPDSQESQPSKVFSSQESQPSQVFSSQESQASQVFSSQESDSTAPSSQSDSLAEELELERLQKQSEELLKAVRSRPFSVGGLPDLGFGDEEEEDGLGLREYCTPEPDSKSDRPKSPAMSVNTQVNAAPAPESPPIPPEDQSEPQDSAITPPITPPLSTEAAPDEAPKEQVIPPPETLPSTPPASPQKSEDQVPSPVVPEREATIRSRGGSKLRVRPSLSRQEAESLVARRRKSELPPLPPLANLREASVEPEVKVKLEEEDDLAEFGKKFSSKTEIGPPLKIEKLGFEADSLGGAGFGETAFEEMERVIEAQKRGYMMRQHSKVVHATSDDAEKHRASKVQERMASSISVDWGNKRLPQNVPRKAIPQPAARKPSKAVKPNAAAPPSQGGQPKTNSSEVSFAPPVKKNPSGEYGRLFIKVIKLKELELALPKDEALYFSCTLDNGLHCVTTPFKLLQTESKIDQEFELIATDKLEFMLTLQVRINLPPAAPKVKGTLGRGALQRIFGSPKKKAPPAGATVKDPYHGLGGVIGRDGSFSRSYVALKTYENAAFGRPFTADIPCLNEWALESGAGAMRGREVQRLRKRPYLIGKIECQLLFVPSVNPMEELPKSMSGAVREMKNAEWFSLLLWEGYLSQQGGDCQHWRRRYFKLIGASLIGYHESTRARRATINLAKSTRVVDDRESLIETPPARGRNGRRKSGFHTEAEGYMYLEEGFRIWFGNGEVIDFRADTREEKREWVNVLQGVVGKVPARKEWAEVVLQRERSVKK